MKQGSPVHFVAGIFQAIAPYAQRMERKTERGGVLRKSHAAPVQRFDMHDPERPESNRTAVRAHAVAIARRPPAAPRRLALALPLELFTTQFPQLFRTVAQLFRAQQMTRPLLERRCRKFAPAAILLRALMAAEPGRNVCRPVWIVGLCPGAARRHRRSSMSRRNPT